MIDNWFKLMWAREVQDFGVQSDKRLTEMDMMLIVLNTLIVIYSAITGITYAMSNRTALLVCNGIAFVLGAINISWAVYRMIRRRKDAKISREYWETKIKELEELLNEDAESEMDIS